MTNRCVKKRDNVMLVLSVYIYKDWFGFFVFNDISTFVGYLTPKPFSKKNSSGTI